MHLTVNDRATKVVTTPIVCFRKVGLKILSCGWKRHHCSYYKCPSKTKRSCGDKNFSEVFEPQMYKLVFAKVHAMGMLIWSHIFHSYLLQLHLYLNNLLIAKLYATAPFPFKYILIPLLHRLHMGCTPSTHTAMTYIVSVLQQYKI